MDSLPSPVEGGEHSNVIIPVEEFSDDLDKKLGRANGNIYHRKPGEPSKHDGQIMVRLKKKRFIIIDYGIVPTQEEMQAAAIHPNVSCLDGAGKQECLTPGCTKVGVPVLLYDSEPTEPASLYMRSGLCFSCQRYLNEKRRTQRKRKGEGDSDTKSGTKKAKVNGETVELTNDSIIINGPMPNGVKRFVDGHSHRAIGADLIQSLEEALGQAQQLLVLTTTANDAGDDAVGDAVAFAAAAAAAATTTEDAAATDAAVNAASALGVSDDTTTTTGGGSSKSLYVETSANLTKAMFLLSQWKAAWDAANPENNVKEDGQAMIPLLLSAQEPGTPKDGEAKKEEGGAVFGV